MVLVPHKAFKTQGPFGKEVFDETKREYQKFLEQLRQILGPRLIVVPEELGGLIPAAKMKDYRKMAGIITREAKKSNFFFRKTVKTFMFGETYLCCVHQAFEGFRRAFKFADEPIILETLTDKYLSRHFPIRFDIAA